jgi:hypothetical protein
MKNIFFITIAVLGFTVTTIAQGNGKKAENKSEKLTKVVDKKGNTVLPVNARAGQVLKKDGTPDKRYKTNPDKKIILKKDGTPDKRYKNNNPKKVVLKKDGTPDKRYKNSK